MEIELYNNNSCYRNYSIIYYSILLTFECVYIINYTKTIINSKCYNFIYYFLFIFFINFINYYKQIKKYYLQYTNNYIEQIIKFVYYFQFINLLILFYIYFTYVNIDHCNKISNIILYYIFILLFNVIIPKYFCIFIITNNEEIEEIEELENYDYEEQTLEQESVNNLELNNSNINININNCNILNNSKIIVLDNKNIINYTNKICIICLEKYIINDTIIELKCNHEFHNNCCMLWFNNSIDCPICRNNLI